MHSSLKSLIEAIKSAIKPEPAEPKHEVPILKGVELEPGHFNASQHMKAGTAGDYAEFHRKVATNQRKAVSNASVARFHPNQAKRLTQSMESLLQSLEAEEAAEG